MTSSLPYFDSGTAYETWWAPVLAPSVLRVLELLEPVDPTRRLALLDVGAGTGTLAFAALRRWPTTEVVALDASRPMLESAEEKARRLPGPERARIRFVEGLADRVPFPDAAFDAIASSFVLQLVPDRPRAFAEFRRLLVPGGTVAFVSWLVDDEPPFAPDEVFAEVLDELGLADETDPAAAESDDFASVEAAVAQLRRAGFRAVQGHDARLVHAYDPARYLAFLEEFAERETFEELEGDAAAAVRALAAERLALLPAAAFVWRAGIVYLRATRPER